MRLNENIIKRLKESQGLSQEDASNKLRSWWKQREYYYDLNEDSGQLKNDELIEEIIDQFYNFDEDSDMRINNSDVYEYFIHDLLNYKNSAIYLTNKERSSTNYEIEDIVIDDDTRNNDMWVKGHLKEDPDIKFQAKVYNEPSEFGINRGRVSKIHIINSKDNHSIADYERGWDVRPSTEEDKLCLKKILKSLKKLKPVEDEYLTEETNSKLSKEEIKNIFNYVLVQVEKERAEAPSYETDNLVIEADTRPWVSGYLKEDPSIIFEAKVFNDASNFGIDGGRISKFYVYKGEDLVAQYERGWEEPPRGSKNVQICDTIIKDLEKLSRDY